MRKDYYLDRKKFAERLYRAELFSQHLVKQREANMANSCDRLFNITKYVKALEKLNFSFMVDTNNLRSKAVTVVIGLTTVYCNTPSLHRKSSILQEKRTPTAQLFSGIRAF